MALEHTRNKYYGDLAKRPNTIRERKADSDVLARAERAKAALRAESVLGGLQDKNYGAKTDRTRKTSKPSSKSSPRRFTPSETKAVREASERTNRKVPSSRYLGTDVGRGEESGRTAKRRVSTPRADKGSSYRRTEENLRPALRSDEYEDY